MTRLVRLLIVGTLLIAALSMPGPAASARSAHGAAVPRALLPPPPTETYETTLSSHRHPRGTVSPHTRVRFSGTLRSEDPACTQAMEIRLYRGRNAYAIGWTDDLGRWKIALRGLPKMSQFTAHFFGVVWGDAATGITTCLASTSRTIRVVIK